MLPWNPNRREARYYRREKVAQRHKAQELAELETRNNMAPNTPYKKRRNPDQSSRKGENIVKKVYRGGLPGHGKRRLV